MNRIGAIVLAAVLPALAFGSTVKKPVPPSLGAHAEPWHYGSFGTVVLYAPDGPTRSVALFLSGDGGWALGVIPMAERLRDEGALVIGIDIRTFLKSLDAGKGECHYAAGDLEELSRAAQLKKNLPEYLRPVLVGYSSGATLAYSALQSAPPETFAGALSLGFCPDLESAKPPCKGRGPAPTRRTRPPKGWDLAASPDLGVPWIVLEGEKDEVCDPSATKRFLSAMPTATLVSLPKVGHGFSVTSHWEPQLVEAYQRLATPTSDTQGKPPDASVADLPLIEVPASGEKAGDLFAILATGDGGWSGLDKEVSAKLAAAGVPVVGWNSLKYYWKPRAPDGAARDLGRIIDHYASAWKRDSVVLVGYSFGADVLPFLVNRLPGDARSRVAAAALIGLSKGASFEFHVGEWLGADHSSFPTVPEVATMKVPVMCLYGEKEDDSACPSLSVRSLKLPGGHHYGGDYGKLAQAILEFAEAR